MDRNQKEAFVGSLKELLSAQNLIVIAQQTGLTVEETGQLRAQVRAEGAGIKVVKNSLARRSIADTPHKDLDQLLSGPTMIAFSESPVGAAKAVVEFANKNDKLRVVGGVLQGKLLEAKAVEALAKLPSLDALRAKLLSILVAPATRLVGVLAAPAGQLARVISAYSRKE